MSQLNEMLQRLLDQKAWQTRLVVYAAQHAEGTGNKAFMRMVCMIMNIERDKVPRMEGPITIEKSGEFDKATGTEIGNMFVDVIVRGVGAEHRHKHQYLMDTIQFRDILRRTADRIGCTDAERNAMHEHWMKCVGRDHRVVTNLGGNVKEI